MAKSIKVRQLFNDGDKLRTILKIKYITDITFYPDDTAVIYLSLPSSVKDEAQRSMTIECTKETEQRLIQLLDPETPKTTNNGSINTGTQVPTK